MTSVNEWLSEWSNRFAAAGIPDPEVDAELLLGHILGLGRGELAAAAITGRELAAEQLSSATALAERRAQREPVQHLTGVAGFRRLELSVGPGVFVPRPETELAAEIAIEALRACASDAPRAVDFGTGSGAIALSMAVEVPTAHVWAVELSAEARAWTERNIARYGDGRVTLVAGDLRDGLPELAGSIDLVASNPPYIPAAAIPREPEVHRFDPPLALYGGQDGLDVVRALSLRALELVRPGGSLVIEHGESQAAEMAALLGADGWRAVSVHRDFTGRDRVTTAVR